MPCTLIVTIMDTRFLFPHRYKAVGWVLFAAGVVLGVLYLHFDWKPAALTLQLPAVLNPSPLLAEAGKPTLHNFLPELSGVLCIAGALLAACSRERQEDEFIMRLRLDALLWALYVNYALLALALVLTYDELFFTLMVYSMFTPLVLFLLRFHYALYRASRAARYAE
ncbi:hypothetical protein [Hymenobacter jeollabukensis]|uniref:Uncharacterized protein n=1 Tax=Hymenobacter jeollabukensis TaxID=2025313 RepID=A0A5R8WLI6_9BACT|nr:hypothetical protein [Hymenobacter jeollabukensis]TLM90002.1 hypothetical protein FDY95_18440 [Hymenobacter jeollabukensis]